MSSLSLTDDISEENFNENLEFIQKNAKIKQNEILEPSYEDKLDIYNIVMNYIKEKKRKIYGGFALNQLFKAKDEKYKLYDDYTCRILAIHCERLLLHILTKNYSNI